MAAARLKAEDPVRARLPGMTGIAAASPQQSSSKEAVTGSCARCRVGSIMLAGCLLMALGFLCAD